MLQRSVEAQSAGFSSKRVLWNYTSKNKTPLHFYTEETPDLFCVVLVAQAAVGLMSRQGHLQKNWRGEANATLPPVRPHFLS